LTTDPSTVVGLLERASGSSDTGLRFLDRTERASFIPYTDVWRRALAVCGGLQNAGVRPGDRVALVFPTSIEFIDGFFGTLLAGAVPVPLYPPVRLHRVKEYIVRTERMLRAVSARLVLADGRVRPILGSAVARATPDLGCRTLAEVSEERPEPVRPAPGDLALIQFSSGTTVDPKPVALSHRAVVEQVVALNSHWPDTEERTHSGVSWLPLYHDMGLIGCVIAALERPGPMTLIPPELFLARPAMWLRAISAHGATISVAPNFAYGLCVEKVKDDQLEGVDLSSWRVALCGAEPVVPRVLRRFIERFGPYGLRPEALTPVYGLSEATLAVTFSDLDRPFVSRSFDRDSLSRSGRAREAPEGVELVSVGRPISGVALQVVDGDGEEVAAGRVGRVLVRGPSIMEGYFDRPEATAEVLDGGWLDTGDLGFLLDGELYLTGREKDVLILRGRSHSPSEVEAAVDDVEGVRTGCSVAVSWLPDDAEGEVLFLLVEADGDGSKRAGREALAEACTAVVRASTGLEVDRVEVLEPGTLPRTSSGKLRRQESLRLHLAGELEAPRGMTSLRVAGAAVRGALELTRLDRRSRD
jgi:acyl-CoA synthetase (AMP-forming)/AMP-acid ligase II